MEASLLIAQHQQRSHPLCPVPLSEASHVVHPTPRSPQKHWVAPCKATVASSGPQHFHTQTSGAWHSGQCFHGAPLSAGAVGSPGAMRSLGAMGSLRAMESQGRL